VNQDGFQAIFHTLHDGFVSGPFAKNVAAWDLAARVIQRGVFVRDAVAVGNTQCVDGANVNEFAIVMQACIDNGLGAVAIDRHAVVEPFPTKVDHAGGMNDGIAIGHGVFDRCLIEQIAVGELGVDPFENLGIRFASDERDQVMTGVRQLAKDRVAQQACAASHKDSHGYSLGTNGIQSDIGFQSVVMQGNTGWKPMPHESTFWVAELVKSFDLHLKLPKVLATSATARTTFPSSDATLRRLAFVVPVDELGVDGAVHKRFVLQDPVMESDRCGDPFDLQFFQGS